MPGRTHEQTFNVALGEVIKKVMVHKQHYSRAVFVEKTGILRNSHKRIDILIEDENQNPVAIETAFDGVGANKDAHSRVEDQLITRERGGLILTSIAVRIPPKYQKMDSEDIKKTLLKERQLFYALYQNYKNNIRRWPDSGFLEGGVFDLFNLVATSAIPKEYTENVAEEVADYVKQAACVLFSLPEKRQEALLIEKQTLLQSLETIALLWLDACFVQYQLGKQPELESEIAPLPIPNKVNPSELVADWKQILKHNWRSIFEPAMEALEKAYQFDEKIAKEAIIPLIKAVRRMDNEHLGLHINIGAELFPKLSHDRKTAAAFYTQVSTAELLARLTIREKDKKASDWASVDFFEKHFLADLACGTGTLLRAGYRRIEQLYKKYAETVEFKEMHRKGMESGLIGIDISPLAAHLATSSLAVIGYGEPYGETRIGWVNVGGEKGETGSIEFLDKGQLYDLYYDMGSRRASGTKEQASSKHSISVVDRKIDWVLMNPPYSRTRGGQSVFDLTGLDESSRKRCQTRWQELTKKRKLHQGEYVDRRAGLAATFLLLAKRKVKPGGRIGFVLPLTAAFADVWKGTRRMLQQHFEDITAIAVVSGEASGDASLSADTGMEEMLLVATRREGLATSKSTPVHCVTLYSAFPRVGEATEIARAIERSLDDLEDTRPIKIGEQEIGHIALFRGELDAPWSLLGANYSELALTAQALCEGKLSHLIDKPISINIEMETIQDIFDVGPTHHLIGHLQGNTEIGGFELHEITNKTDAIGRDRSLWAADSEKQKCLIVQPTHKGIAHQKASNEKREKMRKKQSSLFYARNMGWASQAVLAATTKRSVHGGRAWAALIHKEVNVRKIFALWVNSTFGLVIHWTQGQRTQPGRSTTQIGALKKMPCPRFDLLPNDTLIKAANVFDELADKELLPACQAHADDTRKAIDQSIIEILQLGTEANNFVSDLRRLWCKEPSVHGNNQTALDMLPE